MANQVRTDVDGATAVYVSLGRVARDLGDMAPDQVGSVIAQKSRQAAPFVTGRLRASIQPETAPGRVSVGSGLEYAHVIHNGWAAHNIRPNPFLIPVAENMESVWGPMYHTETARIVARDMRGA